MPRLPDTSGAGCRPGEHPRRAQGSDLLDRNSGEAPDSPLTKDVGVSHAAPGGPCAIRARHAQPSRRYSFSRRRTYRAGSKPSDFNFSLRVYPTLDQKSRKSPSSLLSWVQHLLVRPCLGRGAACRGLAWPTHPMPDVWNTGTCAGELTLSGLGPLHAVRNPGGGTAACCKHWSQAAGARVSPDGSALHLQLKSGARRSPRGDTSRNGARVYLADACGAEGGSYAAVSYAAVPLLGRSLSVTLDLSGVEVRAPLPYSSPWASFAFSFDSACPYSAFLVWMQCCRLSGLDGGGDQGGQLRRRLLLRCQLRVRRSLRRDRSGRGEQARLPRHRAHAD